MSSEVFVWKAGCIFKKLFKKQLHTVLSKRKVHWKIEIVICTEINVTTENTAVPEIFA